MNLSLTPGQYRKLVILTHLGDWVINAFHEKPDQGFAEAASAVLAAAKTAGVDQWVEYDPDTKHYYPSAELDEAAHRYIDHYEDDAFWESLAERLAYRDLVKRLGKVGTEAMPDEQRQAELDKLIEPYWTEFQKDGVDRLELKP